MAYILNRGPAYPSDPIVSLNGTSFASPIIHAEGGNTSYTDLLGSNGGVDVYIRSVNSCRAMCLSGCGSGYCTIPNECICNVGYTGVLCTQCVAGMTGPNCNNRLCRVTASARAFD